MIENEKTVTADTIVSEVAKMKAEKYRLVTMSTALAGEGEIDIIYHFDKETELAHLRFTHALDKPVPSISGVFFAALLVENELQDLFGLKFDGLVLDFNRTLLIDEEITTVPLVNNVKVTQ